MREAEKAATALGIRLQVVEVRDPDEFERALVVIAKDRPDALYVVGNPNLFSQRPRVLGSSSGPGFPPSGLRVHGSPTAA